MNLADLVTASRTGDHNAFRELVRKLEGQVAATVIGMLGHCQEAEDVGQETFIRFYNALNKFRGEAKVETYVTRIAINLSLNELKRRQRKALLFAEQPEAALENLSNQEVVGIDRDTQATVRWAIRQIAPRFRAVIVLRLIDGYSTRETAEILSLPIGTILSRFFMNRHNFHCQLNDSVFLFIFTRGLNIQKTYFAYFFIVLYLVWL